MNKAEVFNLCHDVDPIEIPSSGGGPHGARRTGFNLSYSWLEHIWAPYDSVIGEETAHSLTLGLYLHTDYAVEHSNS